MGSLLAVDLGLRTGLALYGADGRLRWYRSQNFGTATRLRRAVHGVLRELPEVRWLVLEGGGNLAEIWTREAERIGITVHRISARRGASGCCTRASSAAARRPSTTPVTWRAR